MRRCTSARKCIGSARTLLNVYIYTRVTRAVGRKPSTKSANLYHATADTGKESLFTLAVRIALLL